MSIRDFQFQKDRFKVNRGVPGVDHRGRRTYTPRPGYWRSATCKDIKCAEYENGWVSTIPQAQVQMLTDIYEMRNKGIWEFTEERVAGLNEGEILIRFTFPPGLTCFRHLNGTGHQVPVERDPLFYHRPAGRPGQGREMNQDEFITTFNESAYRASRSLERG